MWLLVKYPKYSATPIALETYTEFPEYSTFSLKLLHEGIQPAQIPRVYTGGAKHTRGFTYRIIQANVTQTEAYWAEQARVAVVQNQMSRYEGVRGMADHSREQEEALHETTT